MSLRSLFYVALLSLIPLTGVCQAASITYDFVSYAPDQNGHAIVGTITTDGSLGVIAKPNIVSFNVQVTGPKPQSWTSGDFGIDAFFSTTNSVSAFADRLVFHSTNTEIDLAGVLQPSGFTISFNDPSSPGTLFRTLRYRGAFSSVVPIYEATNSLGPGASWSTNSPIMDGGDDWVIATVVPEPSTIVIWSLLGLAGIGIHGWRRRTG